MGKRLIFILMACSLSSIATVVHAQHIDKQTYTFAIKKADTLKQDKYVMIDQIQGTQSKPVILFAFGGGFKGGRRDNPDYISYFHFWARAGYVVVSWNAMAVYSAWLWVDESTSTMTRPL